MARIPPKTVTKTDAEVLVNLEKDLKRRRVRPGPGDRSAARRRSSCRAPGLREPEKPIGCYLFSGPTGVGKTEVAKQLADLMGIELLRFDMSEYMEKHTVSPLDRRASGLRRLRPGRPADRWHRPASALRAAARRDREGASRPVQHPVAGHGSRQAHRPQRQVSRLPQRHPHHDDERGRLRHGQAGDGLQLGRSATGEDMEAINRMFTPEFRNRLDAVVPFAGLPPEVITKVVEKFIFQLEAQLADRGVTDRALGGGDALAGREGLRREVRRPSAGRVIQEYIKKPLADELLFGKLEHGGTVKVRRRRQGRGAQAQLRVPGARSRQAGEAQVGRRRRGRRRRAADGARRGGPAQGAAEPEGAQGTPAQDLGHRSQRAAPQGRLARASTDQTKAPDRKSGAFLIGFCRGWPLEAQLVYLMARYWRLNPTLGEQIRRVR